MYHDIYESEPLRDVSRSATIYHVQRKTLVKHLVAIKASGRRVITAGEFLNGPAEDSVVLTFVDGWRGAFYIALPLLLEFGFRATFYITRDFVGRDGFCDDHLIVKAADAGMEIGVHGTTHRMLSSCSYEELIWEMSTCKRFLESLLGQTIESSSAPGGDSDEIVVSSVKEVGLKSLCTSRPGVNKPGLSLFHLRRVAIRDTTCDRDIHRYCTYNMSKELVRWTVCQFARRTLGMRSYSLVRRRLLGDKKEGRKELFKP